MEKKLIKTTFFLLLYSALAKVLSFVVRIYLARELPEVAMNYFSLTMPTMVMLISLAQLGIPSAMAKIIASQSDSHPPIKASMTLSLINNILIFIVLVLLTPLMSHFIFKDIDMIAVFYSCLPMIPLVTLTGLLKGYLMGKKSLIPYSIAQIWEEVARFLFLIIALPLCDNPIILAKLAILSMSVGEIASAIYMFFSIGLKKLFKSRILSEKTHPVVVKSLLSIAIPMTLARLIGSISYFFEPILMVMNVPPSQSESIISSFTQINAYILPLITLPSFATIMISNWALPSFSEAYSKNKKIRLQSHFFFCSITSLLIGLCWSILLYLFPYQICQLIYNQTSMAPLLKSIAIPFSVFSIQPILSVFLHACNKSPQALLGTTVGCILRLVLVAFLPLFGNYNSLAIALCVSMLCTTLLHLSHTLKILFQNHI